MQIIIPMSGLGTRFVNEGYKDPKPLIIVDNKPMIEHVVNLFPGEKDIKFICNDKHLKETRMKDILNGFCPHGKIYEVPVSYNPRSKTEGKKISFLDGFHAIRTLIRFKFF